MRSTGGTLWPCKRHWERPGPLRPRRTPAIWNRSCEEGRECQCSPLLSIGWSQGRRIGGIPSSCDTASIHLNCQTIVMYLVWRLISATTSAARREASLWRITTSFMIGLPTLRVRLSPPCTCVITPKYTQIAFSVEGRGNSKGPL